MHNRLPVLAAVAMVLQGSAGVIRSQCSNCPGGGSVTFLLTGNGILSQGDRITIEIGSSTNPPKGIITPANANSFKMEVEINPDEDLVVKASFDPVPGTSEDNMFHNGGSGEGYGLMVTGCGLVFGDERRDYFNIWYSETSPAVVTTTVPWELAGQDSAEEGGKSSHQMSRPSGTKDEQSGDPVHERGPGFYFEASLGAGNPGLPRAGSVGVRGDFIDLMSDAANVWKMRAGMALFSQDEGAQQSVNGNGLAYRFFVTNAKNEANIVDVGASQFVLEISPYEDAANPFRTYTFKRLAAATVDGQYYDNILEIFDEDLANGIDRTTTYYAFENTTDDYFWRIEDDGMVRTGFSMTDTAADERKVQITARSGEAHALTSLEVYKPFDWGESLVSMTEDHGGLGLETTYAYHTSPSEAAGRISRITYPDGSWEVRTYDYDQFGTADSSLTERVFEPWKSTPATAPDPSSATESGFDGKVTRTVYGDGDAPTTINLGYVTEMVVLVDEVEISKRTYDRYQSSPGSIMVHTEEIFAEAAASLERRSEHYPPDAGSELLRNRLWCEYYPKGPGGTGGVKSAEHRYERGTVAVVSDPAATTAATVDFDAYAAPDHDGFAERHLVFQLPAAVSETTLRITVSDEFGRTVSESTHICTSVNGSGNQDESDYELATETVYVYDSIGRATQVWTDGVLVSRTEYVSETETRRTGVDGIVTVEILDSAGRISEIRKDVAGLVSAADLGDIVTTFSYDEVQGGMMIWNRGTGAEANLPVDVQTVTRTGGGLTATSSNYYDLSGKLVRHVDERGLTTRYKHEFLALGAAPNQYTVNRTTETRPDGGTEITEYHLDGRVRSVTGTGVIDRFHHYDIDVSASSSTGFLETTVYTGQDSGPRFETTVTDLAGRTREVRRPGKEGTSNRLVAVYDYDDTSNFTDGMGLLDTISYAVHDAGGSPVAGAVIHEPIRMFDYNGRGERQVSAIDLDGDPEIDLDADRITKRESVYEKTGASWWSKTLVHGYLTATSSAPTLLFERRTRLAPLADAGGRHTLSETEETVHHKAGGGVTTTITEFVLPSQRRREIETVRSDYPSAMAQTVVEKGLVVSRSTLTVPEPMKYRYDGLERLVAVTDPRTKAHTLRHYDAKGQVAYVVEPSGSVTQYLYHVDGGAGAGRVWKVIDATGGDVTYTYDALGNVLTVRGTATYPLDYDYNDAYGTLHVMTTYRDLVASTKSHTTWVRDPGTGRLLHKLDARFDPYGQGEPGDGAYAAMRTDYTYDDDGRLNRRRWARGVETDYAYTDAGELASVEYSDGTTDRFYTYDRAGRLDTATDDAGIHDYSYTLSGLLEQDDIGGTGLLSGVDLDPSYDSAGRKTGFDATSAGNLNYDADFAYDPDVPRLASATLVDATNNLAASYSYHADSDYIDTVTYSRGQTETVRTAYAYDRANRLSSVRTTAVSGGATLSSHGYLHDVLGRRTRATRHDGTYWSYGYNTRSEVTSAAKHLSGGAQAPLAGRQSAYAYDDIGNRRHEDSGGDHLGGSLRRTTYGDGTKSGAANALNQYTTVANHGYFDVIGTADTPASVGVSATYDDGAQNATAAGTHNQGKFFRRELSVDNNDETVYAEVTVASSPEGGRFIGPDNEAPTYDDDGNLLTDARWDYTWNGENRLVEMETRQGAVDAGAPKKKLEFAYDHVGRRIEKKVSDWSGTAWTVASHEKFLYDGWNAIARIDASGNEQQSYLWGLDLSGMRGGAADGAGGVGGLLAVRDESEAKIFVPAYDGNGNVMAYADSSDASVDAVFEYDAYGETVSAFGVSASKLEIRFSSKPADLETGLADYGFRYYAPQIGRWLSRDPIGERGGLNLYSATTNDAINNVDFLGLNPNGVPAKAPNCEVVLRFMHGPSSAHRWMNRYYARVDALKRSVSESAGNSLNFYGRASVIACGFKKKSNLYWIPGVKDAFGNKSRDDVPKDFSDANVGPLGSEELFGFQSPYNAGFGSSNEGFVKYITESWKAALREGNRLAEACGRDRCCMCKNITVKFDLAADAQNARNNRPSWKIWEQGCAKVRKPKSIPVEDVMKKYRNYSPPKNQDRFHPRPQKGSEETFKVVRRGR